MGKILGKKDILVAADRVYTLVSVPEWGGEVRVASLTGQERDAFEASLGQQDGKKVVANLENIRARLVALAVVDEAGERLFEEGDIPDLGKKSAKCLDRVFEAAKKLSGLSDDDVKELAGDLKRAQAASSPSA